MAIKLLTMEIDIRELQNFIRFVAKSGVSEISYKEKDFELKIKTENGQVAQVIQQIPTVQAMPMQTQTFAPTANSEAKPVEKVSEDSKYIAIKSPMIGTFYRKPSPDKPAFVSIGDAVTTGTVVCVVEAMKLFNEIESEISGTIVKILVEDSTPVEFDQPLFLVDPA